ncbi:hypothetical protein D3C76_1159280 [compost metagenome]
MSKDQKPPSDDDYVQVNAIVTRKRRETLKRKAAQANLTISQFVSALIVKAEVVAKPDKKAEIQKLNAWLGRINSNLNMLSKNANIYKSESDALLIHAGLNLVRQDLQKLIDQVMK